jgi:hypothetical protein
VTQIDGYTHGWRGRSGAARAAEYWLAAYSSTRTAPKEAAVSGPFIFIATNKLKPGKLEDERTRVRDLSEFIAANEPRLLAFNEYADESGTEVGVVQVHPDAQSMQFHMNVVRARAASAYAETLDATTTVQVFGTPDDAILQLLRQQAGAGVDLSIKPDRLGGFTRMAAS